MVNIKINRKKDQKHILTLFDIRKLFSHTAMFDKNKIKKIREAIPSVPTMLEQLSKDNNNSTLGTYVCMCVHMCLHTYVYVSVCIIIIVLSKDSTVL